jgi:hypothetical protein
MRSMITNAPAKLRITPESALRLMLRAKTLDESYDILRACFSESEHARIDAW